MSGTVAAGKGSVTGTGGMRRAIDCESIVILRIRNFLLGQIGNNLPCRHLHFFYFIGVVYGGDADDAKHCKHGCCRHFQPL